MEDKNDYEEIEDQAALLDVIKKSRPDLFKNDKGKMSYSFRIIDFSAK